MSDHDRYRQPIPPAPSDAERPLWSVMIPTHNCARYLRETLASVLAQDPGLDQMQIEVVDDCSSDNPQRVVDELAPGRVAFHRQTENVGHIRNFNTCLQRARGHLVHLLHGDDAVRDGFYRTVQQPFHDHPEIGAAFCRYISMDSDGHWQTIAALEPDGRGVLENWLERIAVGQRLQPPTIVVRRAAYEALGGFDARLGRVGEDWEMWVRIAASFPVWYEPEPLAVYRVHDSSISAMTSKTGEYVASLRGVIEINRDALPAHRADALTRKAREVLAATAIRRAVRQLRAGRTAAARALVREGLKTSRAPAALEWLFLFCLVWLREQIKAVGRRAR